MRVYTIYWEEVVSIKRHSILKPAIGCAVLALLAGVIIFIGAGGRGMYDLISQRVGEQALPAIEQRSFSAEQTAWLEQYYMGTEALTTRDGITLTAQRFAPRSPSHSWVLMPQGVQGRSVYLGEAARHLHELGFHVLTFALRGHGESGGDRIGLGVLDKEDLLAFVREIEKEDPEAKIVLYGFSAGASAALLAAPDTPPSVKGIIADSAYASLKEVLRYQWSEALPAGPFLLAADVICLRENGFTLGAANVAKAVQTTRVPLLLLHGEEDQDVPLAQAKEIFKAAKGVAPGTDPKTGKPLKATKFLAVLPGAEHAQGLYAAPEEYWGAVDSFLAELGLLS